MLKIKIKAYKGNATVFYIGEYVEHELDITYSKEIADIYENVADYLEDVKAEIIENIPQGEEIDEDNLNFQLRFIGIYVDHYFNRPDTDPDEADEEKSFSWLELIEEKRDEIMEVGMQAFRDSVDNPHLRFIVEITDSGNVSSWYDIKSGNSYHVSNKGERIKVLFIFKHDNILEDTNLDYLIKVSCKELNIDFNTIYEDYEKEVEDKCCYDLELYLLDNPDKAPNAVERAREKYIEIYKNDNAYDTVYDELEQVKDMLKEHGE